MKQELRRSKVYYLWLMDVTKAEIAEKLQVSESTIDRDLEYVQEHLAKKEIDWDKIRNEALNSLRSIKLMLLEEYENSAIQKKPWTSAKILSILKDIDLKILERVAQPPSIHTKYDIKMVKQEAFAITEFIAKEHPEIMDDLKNFLKKKIDSTKAIEHKTEPGTEGPEQS